MPPAPDTLYVCPGETTPISRAVHLARLAAFFPACRDCPFRTDTGHLPLQTVERLHRPHRRVERPSFFTDEGVRGVYLNELTRTRAGELAAALAGLLWDEAPLVGQGGPGGRGLRPARPSVVVGYDERPSSPDLATGVTAALRRMGCQILDIGLTTRPCFWFAVDHLEASAGVFVTGAGCDPSWTGLDFARRDGLPLSRGHGLERIEARLGSPESRPTRQPGLYRTFQAAVPYEAGLWKHFQGLRPLKVCCGCPSRPVRRTLERIFETLPCRLGFVHLPHRARNLGDTTDADVVRMSDAVRRQRVDLGLLIDDDGQRCAVFDEQGELVPTGAAGRLIAERLLGETPQGKVVAGHGLFADLRRTVEQAGGTCLPGGATQADLSHAMRTSGAAFGCGADGRSWFREASPTSDAVITLARLLDVLSRDERPLSEQSLAARRRAGL